MAEIVNSLFGVDPAVLQQQRQLIDANQAYRFAQLNPMQRAQFSLYQGGAGLGRAANQLLGGDEQLQRATKVRELAAQFDLTTPEGLDQYAQAVSPFAPEVAQQAIMQSNKLVSTALSQEETRAKTEKALRESIRPVGLTPGGLQVYQTGNEQYTLGPDNQRIPYFGPLESKTPKQTINVTGAKNVLEVDQKDAEQLVKTRNTFENSIPLLESSLAALDRGIIGGSFSNARVAFNTALASAGLKPIKNIELLANTKTFNANRTALATSIAKQLGVNPTDRDFQASLDRFAAASENPEASKKFLSEMLALQKQQLADANAGLQYYRANQGSFAGYDRPLPRAFSAGPDLSNLSTDQLKREIERLKNQQKQGLTNGNIGTIRSRAGSSPT